ncbi:MAG: hypothetical protein JXP34_28805 [Planctomycetes bacterium]|nr:hypothetical protein [Planctomycetota bacterium]
MGGLSPRERMLAAIERRQPDRVPCSFMIFAALRRRAAGEEALIREGLALGLDMTVHAGDLPIAFDPGVRARTVKETRASEDLLRKIYETPEGTLEAVVRPGRAWPHGDEVPLCSDFLTPRSEKFLVGRRADLAPLRYLFAPPSADAIARFRERARGLRELARDRGLLFAGGWGRGGQPGVMGMDAGAWLCGLENLVFLAADDPEFVAGFAAIIGSWTRAAIAVYLDAGVELIIKRAWYETTDFWTPEAYRRFILPTLREEVRLAHEGGARFGLITTSAYLPILPDIIGAGVDVLIGVDPIQGKGTDPAAVKRAAAGAIALWGGVNGFITVERGTPEEVEIAVRDAIRTLGPDGGFILSPVDNVRDDSPRAWENVRAFIAAAHEYGRYPLA